MVCTRYLAEKIGLAGANEFENAEISSIVDAISDVMQDMFKLFYEKDEAGGVGRNRRSWPKN